jgi:hypothetical protein
MMWFLTLLAGLLVLGGVGFAGYVAFSVGKAMVRETLANREPLPAWLEGVTPLKGRWFRLFLSAPWISLHVAFVFAATLCYVGATLATVGFVIGAACWMIFR